MTDETALVVETAGNRVMVRGELDAATIASLRAAVEYVPGTVEVDLSDVDFADSSALRAFIELHQGREAVGQRIWFVNSSPGVRRVIELAALDRYLHVRDA